MVRVVRHPEGPRLYLWGWRSHHWHAGLALILVGARWVWRDRADWPWR